MHTDSIIKSCLFTRHVDCTGLGVGTGEAELLMAG